jgi:MOSC domain-containing protein YiiM
MRKVPVEEAYLLQEHGLEGDAHAGPWHRQVSFLPAESIEKARTDGLDVTFGDFAENIATSGIDKCAIYYLAGDCIMPREGVFARVLKGGRIRRGDEIHIVREA